MKKVSVYLRPEVLKVIRGFIANVSYTKTKGGNEAVTISIPFIGSGKACYQELLSAGGKNETAEF